MTVDLIVFSILAIVSIASSVLVVESEEIFHSALFLTLLFVSVGGIFILLKAEFLAAIQVLIYGGAVVIIILFAIMLTKRGISQSDRTPLHGRIPKPEIVVAFVFLLSLPILTTSWPATYSTMHTLSVSELGMSLFKDFVIPFEVVSVALLAALIAGIFLAKQEEV